MKLISELKERLLEQLPAYEIFSEEPLAKHTSFRIGGPAELMVFPRSAKELAQVMQTTYEMGIRPYILGGGTNVLAPDEGVRGVVIVTKDALIGLRLLDETHISAMSGMTLAKTAMFAAQDNLSGLEFAHGIPGTVGGAVYMNAGAYGGEIKDVAVKTEFMRMDGTVEIFEGENQGFAYRSSAFQKLDGVILRTEFALIPSQEAAVREKIKELADRRRAAQPLELPSAGSAFKRPKTGYAAALIDAAGLKGLCVGGAAVSEKHAGFIVNLGGATAADVLALVKQVQQRVYDHSGVLLEPEIRLWGADALQ
ncbi:MAG: UDP-N-acetylmuramate dehydrogenase [Oscillospiraceae bacterium]|nr:UDP-N-acetylmuramate dehydrogenase [Oscillospiraceae bacterium]